MVQGNEPLNKATPYKEIPKCHRVTPAADLRPSNVRYVMAPEKCKGNLATRVVGIEK